jgi:hypothetical protein
MLQGNSQRAVSRTPSPYKRKCKPFKIIFIDCSREFKVEECIVLRNGPCPHAQDVKQYR